MAAKLDGFSAYDDLLASAPLDSPWTRNEVGDRLYMPMYDLVEKILTIPYRAGEVSESGRFARGIDAWIAHELRRMGFNSDDVWPRATRPRVLPRDVRILMDKLPSALAAQVAERLPGISAVAPADVRVLGRAYDKQVDVAMARWDRGPEILISTKAMSSSFGKNLGNRFEEAYGDAGNLRSRYPLAAVGFFFVQRATVLKKEPGAYERTVDMMRKLRNLGGGNGYTATGLLLVDWPDATDTDEGVSVVLEPVPDDVAPSQFFKAMAECVLEATPVVHHVEARSRFEGRDVAIEMTDVADSIVSEEGTEPDRLN